MYDLLLEIGKGKSNGDRLQESAVNLRYSGICYYDISHESFWTSIYSARILEPK